MREPIVNSAWDFTALHALQAANSVACNTGFAAWQLAQLQQFITQGFPNRNHEQWKYTNVAALARQAFSLSQISSDDIDVSALKLENAYTIVFVNGHYSASLSNLVGLPEGIIITDVKTALREQSISAALYIPEVYQTPFSSLNAALLTNGLFITVPSGVRMSRPIHMIHIATDDNPVMNHLRHVINVGDDSEMVIFEEYVGRTQTPYFNNVVTQIKVGQNANVQCFKLQHEGKQAFHIANTICQQQKDSQLLTMNVATGARISRDDLNCALDQTGAHCRLLGLYYLDNERHIDNHSRIDHSVAHCASEQNYKGVIDGKSRAVFNGRIVVHEDAQQTKAQQSNQNLLLAKTAEIDTKPELEIYADDVQCAHGATVGKLDEQALFYLRSRGIDYAMAHHLLTCAFTNEILEQIEQPTLAAKLNQHVVAQLAAKYCCGDCHYDPV